MPEIGTVAYGRDIGKSSRHSFVWAACSVCGKPRWSEILHGKPRHDVCGECSAFSTVHNPRFNRHNPRKRTVKSVKVVTPCPGGRHYWHIETPAGETSTGVCSRCGAVKEFKNSLESDETMNPFVIRAPLVLPSKPYLYDYSLRHKGIQEGTTRGH